jgi:hypothetical protein
MRNKLLPMIIIFTMILVTSACLISPKAQSPVDQNQIATLVQQTIQAKSTEIPPTQTIITPTQPEVKEILSRTVYYLAKDPNGKDQIWKLEKDGKTTSVITSLAEGVDYYDVSAQTGIIAYVTGNTLFLLAKPGDTPIQIVKDDPKTENDLWFTQKGVGYPVWSNDGKKLAFYHAGLAIFTPQDGSIHMLRQNLLEEGQFLMLRELYYPISWSPDDSKMMIGVTYSEGGTMAVYTFRGDQIVKLEKGDGASSCCDSVWAPDGSKIWMSGYSYGGETSDMWMYDAVTGKPSEYLPIKNSNGKYNFVEYPGIVNHQIYFFYSTLDDYPNYGQATTLATSPDTTPASPSLLRNDSQKITEAIWAQDGSFALAVQITPDDEYPYHGDLLYIPTGSAPVSTLAHGVRLLHWGLQ